MNTNAGVLGLMETNSSGVNIIESVALDVSVQGFVDDAIPMSGGARLLLGIIDRLNDHDIRSCFAREAALNYYGTHRTMMEWILCVEDKKLDVAADLVESFHDLVKSVSPSAMKPNGTIDHHFPRFKFTGYRCFFHIVPSWVHHLSCTPEQVEISKTGLPFPKLEAFAQSLVETIDRVDLADLVDGMDLDMEWGSKYLDLEGLTDVEWATKRLEFHTSHGGWPPVFLREDGINKSSVWSRAASDESKARRRGHKALPKDKTRFRLVGQKDPRMLHDW